MKYTYDQVTAAAAEAIAEMADGQHDVIVADAGPRRAASAGVYLLWAHLVGDAAKQEDIDRILTLIGEIEHSGAVHNKE